MSIPLRGTPARGETPNLNRLQPLNKNLVVQQAAAETVTPGGLVIPEAAKEKNSGRGVVLAMAPGAISVLNKDLRDVGVHVGSTVVFQKYAGTRVAGTNDILVLEADEVLGVMAEDAPLAALPTTIAVGEQGFTPVGQKG